MANRGKSDGSQLAQGSDPIASGPRAREEAAPDGDLSPNPHSRPASAADAACLSASSSSFVSLARRTGKVSTRKRRPGEGERARRTRSPTVTLTVTSATGRTEIQSGRRSAPGWSLRSRLLGTRGPPGRTAWPLGARRLPLEHCEPFLVLVMQEGSKLRSVPSQSAHPLATMTSQLSTPSPGVEQLLTTPILQATKSLSPEAEASTALIAVVITVVFLTLLSVVILIFFYLYKNKGSYVTYEPAEGEPSAILQMESDSAKGREKEEYFI
ncbi:small cell adhesion glycoprotein [Tamandua tetradactyla]|uniref:small cell adhesion glycoprotein n=1 Tax=Tamandua tetradactyla TaxID=48850 RepID=UPI0040543331